MSVVSEFFEQLPSRVDPGKTAGLNNSYVFDIEGAGTWTVKVADGGVTVDDGDTGGDCTISTYVRDFREGRRRASRTRPPRTCPASSRSRATWARR